MTFWRRYRVKNPNSGTTTLTFIIQGFIVFINMQSVFYSVSTDVKKNYIKMTLNNQFGRPSIQNPFPKEHEIYNFCRGIPVYIGTNSEFNLDVEKLRIFFKVYS